MILPWGSLLEAVAAPEPEPLHHIASLCRPGAGIEIVFSYDSPRDARDRAPLGAAGLDERHVLEILPRLYLQAGIRVRTGERIPQIVLADYETTWAKRLAFGMPREVWRIRAVRHVDLP